MEKELQDWVYLNFITGSFEGLYRYYFSALGSLAPVFRSVGTSILYSVAIVWAALCALRSPLDRLASTVGVFTMIIIAGFLNSPTNNNKYLGSENGHELSIGAYYSFVVAGTVARVFDNISGTLLESVVRQFAGQAGNIREVIATAFGRESEKFLDKFVVGEARPAVQDYYEKCAKPAYQNASTHGELSALMGVGIGSNNLGLDSRAQTHLSQLQLIRKDGRALFQSHEAHNPNASRELSHHTQISLLDQQRAKGMEYLKNLDPAVANITGEQGYRIPKPVYYQNSELSERPKIGEQLEQLSSSSGQLAQMHAPGAPSTESGSEGDYVFYPKNCLELYHVANKVMANLRQGVAEDPAFKDLPFTGGFNALAVANKAREALSKQGDETLKSMGVNQKLKNGQVDALADSYMSYATEIGNKINKWMLEFKIPAVTASMALLVVVLIICFPIFAILSIIFGHTVLITYFKLMALPFLVIFINRFLLSATALIVFFDQSYSVVINTFMPNAAHASSSLSKMTTETIAFLLLCGGELLIAKALLWDDVKGLAGVNLKNASTASAETGHSVIKAGVGLVVGAGAMLGGGLIGAGGLASKGANAANNAKSAERASSAEQHLKGASKVQGSWKSNAEMASAGLDVNTQLSMLSKQLNALSSTGSAAQNAQDKTKYNGADQGSDGYSLRPRK